MDELWRRTQAKEERIASYLTSLRLIMEHLRRPLASRQQVKMTYKGLTPEYRKQIDQEELTSFTQLGRILRQYEKKKDLDDRYVPTPTNEKMRFPATAFKGV